MTQTVGGMSLASPRRTLTEFRNGGSEGVFQVVMLEGKAYGKKRRSRKEQEEEQLGVEFVVAVGKQSSSPPFAVTFL